MSIYINSREAKIEIGHKDFVRLHDFQYKDGFIRTTGYIGHQCDEYTLGIRNHHVNTTNNGWERGIVEVLKRAGAAGWRVRPILKEGSFVAHDKGIIDRGSEFAGIIGIDTVGGAFNIVVKTDEHSDAKQFILRDSDILGFELLPALVTINKRRVEAGAITLYRHYEQYHEYWVDINVPDTRLLKDIADITEVRGYRDLIRPGAKSLHDYSWVIEDAVDAVVALTVMQRAYPKAVAYDDLRKCAGLNIHTQDGMMIIAEDSWGGFKVQGLDVHIQHLTDIRNWQEEDKEKKVNAD